MWLSLFLLAFLAAATYFLAIQGLTSAFIMAVCTVLSMAVAFGATDYVVEAFLLTKLPDYAHLIAFVGLFVVTLAITRVSLDALVSRSNLLPHLLDRIGAAVVGFFTAMMVTGVLAIALQLVPWPSIIGFNRVPEGTELGDQPELWFQPDRAAARLGMELSDGVFAASGGPTYAQRHPDLITELGWVQAAPVGVRRVAPADAVTFVEASEVTEVFDRLVERSSSGRSPGRDDTAVYEAVPAPGSDRYLRVVLGLTGDTKLLEDADGKLRFVPASIRLIGELDEAPQVYAGMAIPDTDSPNKFLRSWHKTMSADSQTYVATSLFLVPENKDKRSAYNHVIEVVFQVDKAFVPQWVAYKLGGLARYKGGKPSGMQAAPTTPTEPATSATPAPQAAATPSSNTGGGRVSGVKFRSSHFGDDMPITMTAYSAYELERQGNVFEQGQIEGRLVDQGDAQQDQPLERFKVPDGKRLLHLNVDNLRAGSTLGRALNWSVQTVENYLLEDESGRKMTPIGKYAVAKVGNEEYVEIQYFPEYGSSGGRGTRPFNRIKSDHLKGDYQLVYLYLMDVGSRAVSFTTGRRSMDLRDQNLVAE